MTRAASRRALIAALAALAMLPGVPSGARAQGAPDPLEVLRMLAANARRAGYSGEKVVVDFSRRTPTVARYRVLRVTPELERKEYPEDGRVVVREGAWIWNYYPEREVVVKRRVAACDDVELLAQENLKLMLRNYRIAVDPHGHVLDRPSLRVEFAPQVAGSRPLRRVWLDLERGVPLRTEVYGLDGSLQLVTHFQGIRFGTPAAPDAVQARFPGARVVEETADSVDCLGPSAPAGAEGETWAPLQLPDGFAPLLARRSCARGCVEFQRQYSDGLSALSFFQKAAPGSLAHARGESRPVTVGANPGTFVNYGLLRMVQWNSERWNFVLIGELPPEELLRVARSVARR